MITIHTVPKNIADGVREWVTGRTIPWYHFNRTLGPTQMGRAQVDQDKYTIDDLQRFSHYFFPNSKTPQDDKKHVMPLTRWVINTLLPGYEVRRVMGNLTTQMPNGSTILNLPHPDASDSNIFTFLYYVSDSDGKTVFFKDGKIYQEVDPIGGTGVLFPSTVVHAGQCPSINKTRYVINIILAKRD